MFLLGMAAAFLSGCATREPPVSFVVGDRDVEGCSDDSFRNVGRLDVAVVIDTSQSTRQATTASFSTRTRRRRIDSSGGVAPVSFPAPDRSVGRASESRLEAEIRALRLLIERALDYDVRFAIVTYSGPSVPWPYAGSRLVGSMRNSRLRTPLTRNDRLLDAALDRILEGGSEGTTIFYSGMRRATRVLATSRSRSRRKVALFISDSPRNISPGITGNVRSGDPRLKIAAIKAREHEIAFHTFGLSPDSEAWRRRTLGRIAGATGGRYHAVVDSDLLYCHLAYALQRPGSIVVRRGVFARMEPENERAGRGEESKGAPAIVSEGPDGGAARLAVDEDRTGLRAIAFGR